MRKKKITPHYRNTTNIVDVLTSISVASAQIKMIEIARF